MVGFSALPFGVVRRGGAGRQTAQRALSSRAGSGPVIALNGPKSLNPPLRLSRHKQQIQILAHTCSPLLSLSNAPAPPPIGRCLTNYSTQNVQRRRATSPLQVTLVGKVSLLCAQSRSCPLRPSPGFPPLLEALAMTPVTHRREKKD